MYTGHPFALVLVGLIGGGMAYAEGSRAFGVAALGLGVVAAIWDWVWPRKSDEMVGERIASTIFGALLGVTALFLTLVYEPWWSIGAAVFLVYLAGRLIVAVRRANRELTRS
jgi:hypothetical protein